MEGLFYNVHTKKKPIGLGHIPLGGQVLYVYCKKEVGGRLRDQRRDKQKRGLSVITGDEKIKNKNLAWVLAEIKGGER